MCGYADVSVLNAKHLHIPTFAHQEAPLLGDWGA